MKKNDISRRTFLKYLGAGTAAIGLASCLNKKDNAAIEEYKKQTEPPTGQMTYRTNPKTGEKVSLLGYGMMRLPTVSGNAARESNDEIDQEMVNRQVDYAI